MGDAMLHGVLNMPIDLWRDSEIDKSQRHSRYVQASERIRELEAELEAEKRGRQIMLRQQAKSGAMIHSALQSRRHPDEPEGDGYLDAVRGVVAELEAVRNIDRQTVLDCILATSGMSDDVLADAIVQMIRSASVEARDNEG